jgi:hypothetical protein
LKRTFTRTVWVVSGVLAIALVASLARGVLGGPLDPPGPVGSTMRTLGDLLPSWDQILSSSGGCSSARFKCVLGNTAVLDSETGLVWERSPAATTYDWTGAHQACNAKVVGGRAGWRLPTVQELASLADPSQAGPALASGHPFVSVPLASFWTSTTSVTDGAAATVVNMNFFATSDVAKASSNPAWCLRGAGPQDAYAPPVPSPTATPGAADHLSFSTQPVGNVLVNQFFTTMPVVTIKDVGNATVTIGPDSTKAVTLSVLVSSPPAAEVVPVLTCDSGTTVTAVAGVATFSGCRLNHAGPSPQLTATASGVASATSASFAINPGAATALSFSTAPAGAVSSTAFTTQPVVRVVDANADTVWTGTNSNASVTLAAIGGPSALAGCTTNPITATAGVATFGNCSLALVGIYSLTANGGSPALAQGTSASFGVSVGAAAKLAFTTQPGAATGHASNATPLTPQPVVAVEDAAGNIVTTSTAAITLTLTTGGGALACTTPAAFPANATAGVLTPTLCWVSATGAADVITASSPGLTSAVSTAFAVT